MERLTEKHYLGTDHYMKCSGNCNVDMDCIDCPSFDRLVERLAAYENTGLRPVEIKSMQEEHFSGLEMAKLHSALMELKKYQEADKDGRLKIVPRAPKGTVCGSCVHFDRETGTAHGFCKTQTQMRMSAEFPSGRTEPRYVMQSRPACKGYEPLEEDDDGATD
ncbi:MAG: hypothetical protein ACLUF9_01140 [Oscillospiraceae bacterium]